MEAVEEDDYRARRLRMVREQIIGRGVTTSRVLDALEQVPRHLFVPSRTRFRAYDDSPLPIGKGQTISQPYMVALVLDLARVRASDRVLEIGTGSGYSTALLSMLCRHIVTFELEPLLAKRAQTTLLQLNLCNVDFRIGDGSRGYIEQAPYDVILIWAAAQVTSTALFDQLTPEGILVVPEGKAEHRTFRGRSVQTLVKYERQGTKLLRNEICAVSFVPLRSEQHLG